MGTTSLPGSKIKLCTKINTNPHKHKCTVALLRTFPTHVGGILNRKANKQLRKEIKNPHKTWNSHSFFSINQFPSNPNFSVIQT